MIYQKRQANRSVKSGFYQFENDKTHAPTYGFGEGEFVRLRDEFGTVWNGTAEKEDRDTVRFRFRDAKGNQISGISDSYGITLRDQKGNTWRGFME